MTILSVLNSARYILMIVFAVIFAINAIELMTIRTKDTFQVEITKQLYAILSLMVAMSLYLIGK